MVNAISVTDLSVRHPLAPTNALDGISLELEQGKIYGLIGPNGSGKTTLCNTLRGLIPSILGGTVTGSIRILGEDLTELDLLSSILSLKDMAQALETMGASRQASYVVMNSIRLVPELGQRASAVQDAQRSRGIQVDGSRWIRLRALLPTVSPLVLSSLASVEERAIAMEVRGFGVSKDTQLLKPHQKFSVRDALYLLISLLVSTAIALGGRFLW